MIKRYDFKLSPCGEVEDQSGEYIKVADLRLYLHNLKMNLEASDDSWEDHNFFLEELRKLIK